MTTATKKRRANALTFGEFWAQMYGPNEREAGGLWLTLTQQGFGNAGMCVFEQRVIRSHRLHECIECGDTASVTAHASVLVKRVPDYYMCASCDAYYEAKHK